MEQGVADVPLLFSPPLIKAGRSPVSRRLLSTQGSSSDFTNRCPPPSSPPIQVFGGGIGPTVGANWPPSRRREEAQVLEILEKRVGAFHLNLKPKIQQVVSKEERLQNNKTDVNVPDNRIPLLKKILSSRPLVVNNNNEADTEWYTSDFITECLCWHNVYRQRHGVPPLSMCPNLCSYAQEWANTLAHTNTMRYRQNCKDVGQNVYCRLNVKDPSEVAGQQVAAYWYNAGRHYDYMKEPDVLHANVNTGYFTQMIWANTCDVGIGIARSRGGKVMVVANYRPVGNVRGTFQQNVLPPAADFSSDASSEYS